jgi:hypothetical protein
MDALDGSGDGFASAEPVLTVASDAVDMTPRSAGVGSPCDRQPGDTPDDCGDATSVSAARKVVSSRYAGSAASTCAQRSRAGGDML